MSYRHLPVLAVVFAGCSLLPAAAQQATPAPVQPPALVNAAAGTVDEAFLRKQFGEEFALTPISTPYMRDVDGDGVEDLVIVARSKKPMLDAAEHSYKVVDPYYDFYGYGDPKLTATFGSEELMEKNLVILIIHGAGTEAWRSDTPKAKFVIINVPLKKVSVRRLQLRKKQINAVFAEEADSSAGDSVVYWDGKQYKYQPIGTGAGD
jgi:hypothetical protein